MSLEANFRLGFLNPTSYCECLSRTSLDPFAVDEADVLLQQRRIFELIGVSVRSEPFK
jgi:hypothetical protein